MADDSLHAIFRTSILTIPGLDGSGPDHWQSLWEMRLPGCERVQMGDWAYPVGPRWVERLNQAVARSWGPMIIAAHGLGCLTVAAWAYDHWVDHPDRIVGALLVAPTGADPDSRATGFSPAEDEPLPFPSLLVASRNDPLTSFAESQRLAKCWGSRLVDAGPIGHIDAGSALGQWDDGLKLLASLQLPETDPLSPLWDWEPQARPQAATLAKA